MKRPYIILLVVVLLALPTICRAAEMSEPEFKIGVEMFRYHYKEPTIDVSNKGIMAGPVGSYTQRFNRLMLRLEGRANFGDVDYESDDTGSVDNQRDYILEGRLLAGYDILDEYEDEVKFTLYTGFGYRFLFDEGRSVSTSTGNWGYDRESNYFYVPFGIEGSSLMDEDWLVTGNFEYDLLLAGHQTSGLADGNPTAGLTYTDLENDQNKGYGLRASIAFRKSFEAFDLSIEPYARWWVISMSEISTYLLNGVAVEAVEPKNETTEYGANLSLIF